MKTNRRRRGKNCIDAQNIESTTNIQHVSLWEQFGTGIERAIGCLIPPLESKLIKAKPNCTPQPLPPAQYKKG